MHKYTSNLKKHFFDTLIGVAVINLIVLVTFSLDILYLTLLLSYNVIILTFTLIKLHIKQISVDGNILQVVRSNVMGNTRLMSYNMLEIDFMYRNRPVRFSRGIGFYNNRENVLTIFLKGIELFDLIPDEKGWKDDIIFELAIQLKQFGVKQLIEKFGDDDVILSDKYVN